MSSSAQIKDLVASSSTPVDAYAALLSAKAISFDRAQKRIVDTLQVMFDYVSSDTFQVRGQGFFAKLRNRNVLPARCGMYIWGGVGRGKSMLMDLFYNLAPVEKKRRIHFHAFMREVHARIHEMRQSGGNKDDGLLNALADELSEGCLLLCLDEFQVHDITDASILSRLFVALFQKGVLVITTSNRPPEDLYKNGIQREQFLPFIELMNKHMEVCELASQTDYRLEQMKSLKQVYFSPLGPAADNFMHDNSYNLTRGQRAKSTTMIIQNRKITIPWCAGDVAWFTFEQLCGSPLGAGDYLELAESFHTILLQDIPELSPDKRNEAKRFVTLIDAMYERKTNLICTAAVPPEGLYPQGDGSFEFGRTISRLKEMQSHEYLEAAHIR